MAKRTKSEVQTQDLLAGSAKAPTPAPVTPAADEAWPILEYTPLAATEKWRVEKFEEFIIEFGMTCAHLSFEHQMVAFHELGLQNTRPWLICRRLFGIGPMIPSSDSHPDDLRPNTRKEVCATLGLESDELQAELDSLRTLWANSLKQEERVQEKQQEATQAKVEQLEKGLPLGDELLREFGFDELMFELTIGINATTKLEEKRSASANRAEKDWFCKRLNEWGNMLREPMAGAIAREALVNELYLRRFEAEMSLLSPSMPKWKSLYENKKQIETVFKQQIAELQSMFPESATSGKEGFRWVLSGINKAYREYYARGDRQLIDKVFAPAEIEVMLRQSAQAPEPRYRFGMNIAIVEAMHGLYNANWRPQFKPAVLKKLDAGFKEAVMKMRETMDEPLVDLEKGVLPGEGEDYPDLKDPEEGI